MSLPSENQPVVADRYQLIRVLGHGGSATTYEAIDLTTNTRVAVKEVPLSTLVSWKAVDLFERESQVLSNLDHSGIPRYLAHFKYDSGGASYFYLIQTLAEGSPLSDRLGPKKAFSENEVKALAQQLLRILHYLQTLNPPVVHRDIKPQNLLLTPDGKVSLIDFGVVQKANQDSLSYASTVAGTFGYMAPEQMHGKAVPASDLYSVGCTLLHCLSGKPPHSFPRTKLKIDFHSQVSCSPGFASWLEKLIEPTVEKRFGSAKEALTALREADKGVRSGWLFVGAILILAVALWYRPRLSEAPVANPTPAPASLPAKDLPPKPSNWNEIISELEKDLVERPVPLILFSQDLSEFKIAGCEVPKLVDPINSARKIVAANPGMENWLKKGDSPQEKFVYARLRQTHVISPQITHQELESTFEQGYRANHLPSLYHYGLTLAGFYPGEASGGRDLIDHNEHHLDELKRGVALMEEAAEKGIGGAAYNLAPKRQGTSMSDTVRTWPILEGSIDDLDRRWACRAAELGDSRGQMECAEDLFDGVGGPVEKDLAFQWAEKALAQGDLPTGFNLDWGLRMLRKEKRLKEAKEAFCHATYLGDQLSNELLKEVLKGQGEEK